MSSKKQTKTTGKKKSNLLLYAAIAVTVLAIGISVIGPKVNQGNTSANDAVGLNDAAGTSNAPAEVTASSDTAVPATLNDNGDVVIQTADITETATFISYDSNGTAMGLFAVRASDGTIRTALDTCQVCQGSPKAYFIQQGDDFQCQNCGNIYSQDMIEQERGGCNPIPIMPDEKTVTDTEIIIPAQLFEDNAESFANWKKF